MSGTGGPVFELLWSIVPGGVAVRSDLVRKPFGRSPQNKAPRTQPTKLLNSIVRNGSLRLRSRGGGIHYDNLYRAKTVQL